MKLKTIKKRAIAKLLTMLGFSSAAFVFAACYGTMPKNYQNQEDTDSVMAVFDTEADSLIANEGNDSIQ